MPTFSLSTRAIWALAMGSLLFVLSVLSALWLSDRQEAAVRSARHTLDALQFSVEDNPAQRIDLLIADIVMPGMTGRQLADAARGVRPDLKLLYTTGYTRNAMVHNGIVDYDVAFLPKPFSVPALARKVRDVLDSNGDRGQQPWIGDHG